MFPTHGLRLKGRWYENTEYGKDRLIPSSCVDVWYSVGWNGRQGKPRPRKDLISSSRGLHTPPICPNQSLTTFDQPFDGMTRDGLSISWHISQNSGMSFDEQTSNLTWRRGFGAGFDGRRIMWIQNTVTQGGRSGVFPEYDMPGVRSTYS